MNDAIQDDLSLFADRYFARVKCWCTAACLLFIEVARHLRSPQLTIGFKLAIVADVRQSFVHKDGSRRERLAQV
jgi:hypothetical protein